MIHDAILNRTTTGSGPVIAATLVEVLELDAGHGSTRASSARRCRSSIRCSHCHPRSSSSRRGGERSSLPCWWWSPWCRRLRSGLRWQ
ncbi:MAG TPA: hypothetical protein ENI86_10635 [Acidimicrobiales bacterium]|nr:hypothetical protein [Acidimicrobiales bacterium]